MALSGTSKGSGGMPPQKYFDILDACGGFWKHFQYDVMSLDCPFLLLIFA